MCKVLKTWSGRFFSSCFQRIIDFISPDINKSKLAARFQLLEVAFIAILAAAGVVVQCYTDSELTLERVQRADQIEQLHSVTFELYDLCILLIDEMQPFYEFNQGDYDAFLKIAEQPMRAVDNVSLVGVT